jgi:hypothetical protein
LLGNDKTKSYEMGAINGGKYMDIFNATNVLYEELKKKCI